MTKNQSHKKLLLGIIIGIILGVLFGGFMPSFSKNFAILGEIFLNLLMMIVVPLVILSIIVGITNLGDIRNIGSIGRRTISYYLITTGLSVLVGIILVNIIRPGAGISAGEKRDELSYQISEKDSRLILVENATLNSEKYNKITTWSSVIRT